MRSEHYDWTDHYDRISRFFRSRFSNAALASDLTQDTFLRAYSRKHHFRDFGTGVAPWLFTIARHIAASAARREARFDRAIARFSTTLSALTANGEENELDAVRVERALLVLSAKEREILILRHYRELGFKEIGARVGKTPQAVRQAHARALRKLRASHLVT